LHSSRHDIANEIEDALGTECDLVAFLDGSSHFLVHFSIMTNKTMELMARTLMETLVYRMPDVLTSENGGEDPGFKFADVLNAHRICSWASRPHATQ
jgi:hypothetical protein